MTLAAGTRLGSYEITAKLGEGGMGEVYRARDTKLQRDVAIKVLPAEFAADRERLERFDREARAVAALSHPNILAIFDSGSEAGQVYAVMELLEGESLRERLRDGPLGTRKAVEIAAEIAQGLAAAHERGIVHRDLKPENVFVLPDGRVKILDFGLARESAGPGSKSQLLAAPTEGPGTAPGAVLGTVGYMAPEQVRGLLADARADLFALGVILYEMLTGRRAFLRDSSVETMSAILREEPPELATLAGRLPAALEQVLRRCLEKRPEERFQSARDLAFALRAAIAGSTPSAAALGAVRGRRPALPRLLLASALALAGILVGWALGRGTAPRREAPDAPRPTFRQLTKLPGGEGAPSLAPDGSAMVYERAVEGQRDLFLQRVDGQTAILLTGDCREDDRDAAFSPDGTRIAYRSECRGGGIFVIGATGENVRRIADFGFHPAWSPDGRELAVATEGGVVPWNRPGRSELWAIEVDSGRKRLVTRIDSMHPSWSPSGRRIAVWGLPPDSFSRDLWTVAADGSEQEYEQAVRLTDDPELDWNPVWAGDGGRILFASSRGGTLNLWQLPVDEASGRRLGDPEPVTAPSSWAGWMSASRDGRRIAFVDRNVRATVLRAPLDPGRGVLTGEPEPVPTGSMEVYDAELSPDGEWLAVSSTDPPQQIFVVRADGGSFRQITEGSFRSRQSTWSPDGNTIAFQSSRFVSGIALIRIDGGGLRELAHHRSTASEPVWSPDGRAIAFGGSQASFLLELTPALEPGAERELALPSSVGGTYYPSSFSPDGSLLAGGVRRDGANAGAAIYSLRDGTWRLVDYDQAGFKIRLLDDTGRFVADTKGAIVAVDGPGKRPRVLAEAAAGHRFRNLSISNDRRWLAWIDETDESDIWLMTLDDAARREPGRSAGAAP